MSETLPEELRAFVQRAVATGEYASEDDVVAAGVRALQILEHRRRDLHGDIQTAIQELDRGEGEPWDAELIKAELDDQFDAAAKSS